MRGRMSSARAKASICCSPPESDPAASRRRSPSTGKRSYWASMRWRISAPVGRGARLSAAIRRFSSMLMRARMQRPSGTSTIPSATAWCAGSPVTSRPSRSTCPRSGRSRPATAASVLVFPAPFGPMRVTTCPASTRSDRSCTAWTWP